MLTKLIESKWFSLSGWVLGLLGLIVGIVSNLGQMNGSILYWIAEDRSSILAPYDGVVTGELATLANGRTIRIIDLALWNSGQRDITPEDGSFAYVSTQKGQILKVERLRSNFRSEPPTVDCSEEGCTISLETLRQGYGHQFRVITSEASSEDIALSAEVTGGRIDTSNGLAKTFFKARWMAYIAIPALFWFCSKTLGRSYRSIRSADSARVNRSKISLYFDIFVDVVFAILGIYLVIVLAELILFTPDYPF